MKMRMWLALSLLFFFQAIPCSSAGDPPSLSEAPYDIAFEGADIKAALRFLAAVGQFNLIVPDGIEGNVTVSFRGVGVKSAMVSILKANDLDYTVENNVWRVGEGNLFSETGEDLKTETFVLNYASAGALSTQIQSLLSKRGSIIADERTNTITVKDMGATIDQVQSLIASVDRKDRQVLIEAKIIEASRDFSRDLGVQWGVNSDGTNRLDVSGLTGVGTSEQGNPLGQNLGFPKPLSGVGLSLGRLAGGTNVELQIQMAEQKGKARIVSSPSIVTTNGMPANIRSGETLLVRTSSGLTISTGTTTGTAATGTAPNDTSSAVQQIETGIELNVTPQISSERHIKLLIESTTSQADFSRSVDGMPVILDNRATTTVLIRDQETTVIGGLVQNNTSVRRRGVPGLSKVPLLGGLFRSKSRSVSDSELIIFIKPTILDAREALPSDSPVKAPDVLEPHAFSQSVAGQAKEEKESTQVKAKKGKRGR